MCLSLETLYVCFGDLAPSWTKTVRSQFLRKYVLEMDPGFQSHADNKAKEHRSLGPDMIPPLSLTVP